ncbi:hypothetical protein [Nitrosopumilus sp.]|uniref:hypothetical protein n=1 Tax=Nitrosopumilus sp. TaxID=2024843 RepID=UPI003D09F023
MNCTSCKNEVLEKFTNEEYSEYLQNKKRAERQGIELGWFCVNCSDKMCIMCRNGVVAKFIPAKEQGEIRKKIPACQNCFDKFKRQLENYDEIDPKQLEPLPNVTHEEWQEFIERLKKTDIGKM